MVRSVIRRFPGRMAARTIPFAATVVVIFLVATPSSAPPQNTYLLGITDTSAWIPPSPDPAGIVFWPAHGSLLVSDSEVDEMPNLLAGVTLFETTTGGSLVTGSDLRSFTSEPTGIAISDLGHFFISDDDLNRIFEVDPGADGSIGTPDDAVTSFGTVAFGCHDPEDIAFGNGKLFVLCGIDRRVFVMSPGPNGVFDGVPPAGDDTVTQFDTNPLGLFNPEGIAFNPSAGTLFLVGGGAPVIEATTDGTFVRALDISAADPLRPDGVTWAPSHLDSARPSLYILDRGVDNNDDPTENDGRIIEIDPALTPPPSNLLANPSFELDILRNGKPTYWSLSEYFDRATGVAFNGNAAGRFFGTDNGTGSVIQTVARLAGGESYDISGWVNIPPTNTPFHFRIRVRWRDAAGTLLRTDTVADHVAPTTGWIQSSRTLVAPVGSTHAELQLVAATLMNTTVYVDDVAFGPHAQTPTPTPTSTPQPTATPAPPPTPTPTPIPTSTPDPTATPTFTPVPPTATPTLIPEPTATPTFTPEPTATPTPNLLANPSFEDDANGDGLPDLWTTDSRFTRSSALVFAGSFSGRFSATDNSSFTIKQTVPGLSAGASYQFSGWVNIPFTADKFSFKIKVTWRNAANATLGTTTVKVFSKPTAGWVLAAATLIAPAGTTNAQVILNPTSLNETIYVDDLAMQP